VDNTLAHSEPDFMGHPPFKVWHEQHAQVKLGTFADAAAFGELIFNCTYGKEEPERATLPFVAANIAATAGQDAVVLLTIEAVWLGTDGGTDGIAQPGLPVLDDLYKEFIDNGGAVWVCGACAKPRGIGDEQLRKGSVIVGAAKVVEEVIAGAKTVAFA
jgi:predicted peroxiredoxin